MAATSPLEDGLTGELSWADQVESKHTAQYCPHRVIGFK